MFLCGSFNDWQPDEYEMQKQADSYELELELPPGRYLYKFIVDGRWQVDEKAELFEDDGKGGRNSVVIVGSQSSDLYLIPVEFISETRVKTVHLAGSFNNWNPTKEQLEKIGEKKFKIHLLLPEGEYEYKFIIDGKNWQTDPTNPHTVPDNQGGENSVLTVDENSTPITGQEQELFGFNLVDKYLPVGENIHGNLYRFACRTYRNNVDSVILILNTREYTMTQYYSDTNYDYYSRILESSLVEYDFRIKLIKDSKIKFLSATDGQKKFKLKSTDHNLEWIKKSVIYQIFCDRFCNGDAHLNQNFAEWYYNPKQNPLSEPVRKQLFKFESDWSKWQVLQDTPQKHFTFFGGDLVGVIQKIPYLKKLGVNCLYFNPLVESASNHKYDTYNYFEVDPHFGGNNTFKKLVKLCHQNNIKIILDFAFNHVGTGFFAFQDCLKHGINSKFFNWFDWYKWPLPNEIPNDFSAADYYQCWWGHADLPDLNYDLARLHPEENYLHDEKDAKVNEPMIDYLLQVAEFWLTEMDIDGFRLDVPNEVPFWFWKRFRCKVKTLKPDAFLVGEIWQNAEEWLGSYFDAVMNYSFFREPILQYFALQNWNSEKFLQEMLTGLHSYGFAGLCLMMNLLDSHDTHRFLETVQGDIKKLKLAVLFQLSWIGVPHLFYGDEVGLKGGDDPDNRRPMNWKFEQEESLKKLHDFYAEMIKIRMENESLIFGDVRIRQTTELLVFERFLPNESILVIINNSAQNRTYYLNDEYENLLDKKRIAQTIRLHPFEGKLLKKC